MEAGWDVVDIVLSSLGAIIDDCCALNLSAEATTVYTAYVNILGHICWKALALGSTEILEQLYLKSQRLSV